MTPAPLWLCFCQECGSEMAPGDAPVTECPKCRRRLPYPGARPFGATEWDAERKPERLLGCLTALGLPPSERKRRLLRVAVARAVCDWCQSTWFRLALETAERWADASGPPADLGRARNALSRVRPPRYGTDTWDAWQLAFGALADRVPVRTSGLRGPTRDGFAAAYNELHANPFLATVWSPGWFTSTVRDLAQHIYDTRDFDSMPILADALQDAGCDDEPILTHCRASGPHTRGCWVLDAVLEKL